MALGPPRWFLLSEAVEWEGIWYLLSFIFSLALVAQSGNKERERWGMLQGCHGSKVGTCMLEK